MSFCLWSLNQFMVQDVIKHQVIILDGWGGCAQYILFAELMPLPEEKHWTDFLSFFDDEKWCLKFRFSVDPADVWTRRCLNVERESVWFGLETSAILNWYSVLCSFKVHKYLRPKKNFWIERRLLWVKILQ